MHYLRKFGTVAAKRKRFAKAAAVGIHRNYWGKRAWGHALEARRLLSASLVELHSMTSGMIGPSPNGVVADSVGNLYGTTPSGGSYGLGTVFELSGNDHTTYQTLFSFSGSDGNHPGGTPATAVTIDSQGNLFGTTEEYGASNYGSIFELAADHTTFTTLVSFSGPWVEAIRDCIHKGI